MSAMRNEQGMLRKRLTSVSENIREDNTISGITAETQKNRRHAVGFLFAYTVIQSECRCLLEHLNKLAVCIDFK